MWWYGRGNSGGSWLPEEKKANMWHGRGNSGGSWPPAFPLSGHRASISISRLMSRYFVMVEPVLKTIATRPKLNIVKVQSKILTKY